MYLINYLFTLHSNIIPLSSRYSPHCRFPFSLQALPTYELPSTPLPIPSSPQFLPLTFNIYSVSPSTKDSTILPWALLVIWLLLVC